MFFDEFFISFLHPGHLAISYITEKLDVLP
jgi:hypothetical protein